MLLWVWIAVVVVALVILVAAAVPLLGRLGGLRRAALRLQSRQADAVRLQERSLELERTVLEVQQRAEAVQAHVAGLTRRR